MSLFLIEPKVTTIRGQSTTRWELTLRSTSDDTSWVIGDYASKSAAMRALVTHPDHQGHGTVVDNAAPAWTPDELTIEPPAAGMVKVRWHDSVDTDQLYWEYAAELRAYRSP